MSRGAIATIDLSALRHNFSKIQTFAKGRSILAMIKSNGYGHGLLRIAKNLLQADAFGVASLDEALSLREAGIQNAIVVMAGFFDPTELPFFVKHQLTAVIHNPEQIHALARAKLSQPLLVWLKIDTGMHRLGFPADQAAAAHERLSALPFIQKPIGLMTHLADADHADSTFTDQQIQLFNKVMASFNGPKSIVNSAGLLRYPHALADWVRPGITLYGISPFATRVGAEEGLKPVMTLQAKLMAIKQCSKGDAVGYGCTWHCPEAMPIGIVGIGYGDGYPRHAKNGTPTFLNGKICPLVGLVSMDMIAIDLREQPRASVGEPVILWGEALPVEKVAACADTIAYELLCGVTQRVLQLEGP